MGIFQQEKYLSPSVISHKHMDKMAYGGYSENKKTEQF